jgi:hypothetical protein
MIREEYEGQSSETYGSYNDEQVIFYAYSGTTENRAYQSVSNLDKPIYLIDEDSVSLAAQPTMTEEDALLLCRSSRIRHTIIHVPLFDLCSLGKLQI